jgi:adenylosuccinate synthase
MARDSFLKIYMKNIQIILGTVFGDEGKGITTDYKCSINPYSSIVVRFSAGQQAGHNVKIGDITHIHSSYGSGTLRGVPSYFSEHCTMYPVNMFIEQEVLNSKGITPEIYLHPLIMVTTPADVAYNRMIESKLGHGTCGLGIGATMKRNLNTGHKLYGIDLTNTEILRLKCDSIYWYYRNQLIDSKDILNFKKEYAKEAAFFFESIEKLKFRIKYYDILNYYNNIIFEGSQGIMLDMDHGIFPNLTFAKTKSKNALDICNKLNFNKTDIEISYVTRCYQTRHGAGWMSNNKVIELINNNDEINIFNEWQRDFKIAELDYNILNYAIDIDNIYSHGIDKSLVVTCLDQRPDFKFKYGELNTKFERVFESRSPDSKDFKIL